MFFLGLLLALGLAACETVETAGKKNKMDFDLKAYGHEVRWGQIEALPGYLKPELVAKQAPVAEDPTNIRVTGYETLVPPHQIDDDRNKVSQTVRINYIFRDRQVVRSLVDEQRWEYDSTSKKWYRANSIPVFK